MKTFYQQPENVIEETWQWLSDVQVSDNGTEQRIQLRPYPKRTIKQTILLETAADVRSVMTTMFAGVSEPFLLPFWHHQVRLSANRLAGTDTLACTTQRSDLRQGGSAVLVARDGQREVVVIASVTDTGVTLEDPLVSNWRKGSLLVPMWQMYMPAGGSFSRLNPDYAGGFTVQAQDSGFMIPFLDALLDVDLTMFDGLPVLDINAVGQQFEFGVDTGAEWTDYGGVVEGRNPWKHAQFVMPRSYLCHRVLEPLSWNWWRTFADYCRGSVNPFWLPSFRQDYDMVAWPAPNGTTMTFEGPDYVDEFWPHAPFKKVAIYSELGVHYATVTAAAKVGGNSVLTFAPALPNVAGWANEQKVSVMMKTRLTEDKMDLSHGVLDTMLSFTVRTVDA